MPSIENRSPIDCWDCSDTVDRNDAVYSGGSWYCQNCYDNMESDSDYDPHDDSSEDNNHNSINSYGYHPTPRFWDFVDNNTTVSMNSNATKIKPYVGIELETEDKDNGGNSLNNDASYIHNLTNGLIYVKDDCSLRNGFEMVSHPMSLDFVHNDTESIRKGLRYLRKKGYRAWTTSNCGQHIHISKNSFINPQHEMKFLYFIFRNKQTLINFVGRNSQYAQYDLDAFLGASDEYWHGPKPTLMEVAKGVRKNGDYVPGQSYRNLAVNRLNEHTHELRIFRPSLRYETLLSYIEFVYCLFEYTKEVTAHQVIKENAINKFDGLANYARSFPDIYPNFIWKMHTRPNVAQQPDGWINNPSKDKKENE
jgi:hypothetical protein